ncbi:unnamed protein product [Amaranthus hypochondriacus]
MTIFSHHHLHQRVEFTSVDSSSPESRLHQRRFLFTRESTSPGSFPLHQRVESRHFFFNAAPLHQRLSSPFWHFRPSSIITIFTRESTSFLHRIIGAEIKVQDQFKTKMYSNTKSTCPALFQREVCWVSTYQLA